MNDTAENRKIAARLGRSVSEKGGKAYFVGGCVRDMLMDLPCTDFDIEVHGLTPRELEDILDSLGERISIGESFGIYNLKGYDIDIAMPRKEKLRGLGHRDFDIVVDPFIGPKAAAKRRDFTVNAMMQDLVTGEITDCFGGRSDLADKRLRHVSDDSFAEDALRVLRGAQFAARFDFTVADETIALCRTMDLSNLPGERIEGELKKALLKAEKPSLFFETLRKMEALDFWFPELKALIGVEQNPVYHAEGDVWNHTMMVLDEAAKLRHETEDPYRFMLSALCHDFGKAVCTELSNGVIRSYRHETEGLPIAERFLRRFTRETKLIEYVLNMTELHMQPLTHIASGASIKSTNRMFDKSVDPQGLVYLARADDLGRINTKAAAENYAKLLERLEIFKEYMSRPYVMGRDLLEHGLKPGKNFTELLSHAHKLRLAGIPKEQAIKQVLSRARELERAAHKQN